MRFLPTIVLDKTYRPFSIFDSRKAFLLEVSQRCEVLSYYSERYSLKSSSLKEYKRPLVIRVSVLAKRELSDRPSKMAIFLRDDFTCAYCGRVLRDSELTVDHIVPRSRGGEYSWTNLVTCCPFCNQKKGSRTPEEAGMELLFRPKKLERFEVELRKVIRKKDLPREFFEALEFFTGRKKVLEVSK